MMVNVCNEATASNATILLSGATQPKSLTILCSAILSNRSAALPNSTTLPHGTTEPNITELLWATTIYSDTALVNGKNIPSSATISKGEQHCSMPEQSPVAQHFLVKRHIPMA